VNTKLYLVYEYENDYERSWNAVIGVFDSSEAAMSLAAQQACPETRTGEYAGETDNYLEYRIEEIELNQPRTAQAYPPPTPADLEKEALERDWDDAMIEDKKWFHRFYNETKAERMRLNMSWHDYLVMQLFGRGE